MLPVPFLRSVGFGGLLIPLVSVLVALTLLPCVLRRSARGSTGRTGADRRRARAALDALGARRRPPSGGSRRSSRSLLVLAALAIAASHLKPGISDVNTIAKAGDAKQGLVALERSGIGAGRALPYEILTPAGRAGQVRARGWRGVDGMPGAIAPAKRGARRHAVVDVLRARRRLHGAVATLVDDVRDRGRRRRSGARRRRPAVAERTTSSTRSTDRSRS